MHKDMYYFVIYQLICFHESFFCCIINYRKKNATGRLPDAVVEYALSRSLSPTLVSDYRLCLPDKKLLQDKLREITDVALEDAESTEE